MKTLLIGTALALEAGSPQQRGAHALRRSLERHSAVSHLTIDIWGREWSARARMAAGDRLMAARRNTGADSARPFLTLAQAEPTITPAEVSRRPPTALLQEPWMNQRRRARITALALQIRPDLIVITDPLLADLAPYLRWPGVQLVLLDNGLAGWAEQASASTPGSEHSQWLRLLAEVSTIDQGKLRRQFDRIVPGLGQDANTPAALLPLELAADELFFSKTRNLVVPATGYSWFDRQVLAQVQTFLDHCDVQGLEMPNLVLTGFAPALLRDFADFADAEIHPDWQRLQNSVGAARCLYLPVLTPVLAQLALAAVAVGTPVLTTRRSAALYGLAGQPGIFAEISTALPQALAQVLDDDLLGPEAYRAIAAAAAPLSGAVAQDRLMRLILQDSPDSALPLGTARQTDPAPQRRVPPCSATPQVLYNPVTQMLLVRLQLLISAQIDEVRLLDFAGSELNRLAPPTPPARGHIMSMEGGVVVDQAALSGGLRVELHDPFGLVASHDIAVAQFETLRGEIAMAHLDDNMLRGAFWVQDSAEGALGTNRWAVGFAPQKTATSLLGARAMPEIGASAVPFAIPLPAKLTPQTECLLWSGMAGTPLQNFAMPVQRPHRETNASLNMRPQPRGAIAALKNIHVGKRAWIVGNGPSVRLEDLAAIPKDDISFCFNRFYLSYGDNPLRETYVVSADTLMIKDFGQEMIDLAAGLPLFCLPPSRLPDLHGEYVLLPPADHYLPLFSQDPEKFVTVGGSSVFVALQMAWYMGIRDVVLYGMDYSFSVKMQRDPRFPFPVSFEEGNHFIKSYRGAKPWCPPTWRDISAGFLNARVAFELTGGRILNATRGGRLQTFARADFDEIRQRPVGG